MIISELLQIKHKNMKQNIIKNDVFIQDQTTELVDVFFCKLLNVVNLASNVLIDTSTASFNAWHNFAVGDMACFKELSHFFQAQVIAVNTNTITIDRPFDYAFTTSAWVQRTTNEVNTNWSITPQIYMISPVWITKKFDITKIIFHIEDDTAMDSGKFWGITALTKGVVLRKKDGVYKSIFNIKTNWDFAQHCAIIQYDDKAPSGQYWFRAIKEISWQQNHGVVIRLDPALNDELQIIIQDDLTAIKEFHCIALGHVVDD